MSGTMRSVALLLPLLVACAATPEEAKRLENTEQLFTSREAVLLDFELDGRLIVARNIADPKPFIEAQLMYTVGQLNGDRAVGRHGRLELSNIEHHAIGPEEVESEVTYHARLPVAWGPSPIPNTYVVTVPARVAEEDQTRFAERYGGSCVDASAGDVNAGSMFLFYRPQRIGCDLQPGDVVSSSATVTTSVETAKEKYPEYDRIWDDSALDVVAMFSRAEEEANAADVGVHAHDAFVRKAQEYLLSLQPNNSQRTMTVGSRDTSPVTKLAATLPDGRVVTIDVMLVEHRLREDDASFDGWYDALTPKADLILYNGHAGHGENVRTLMKKGSFLPHKYAIWSVNACDTFAYVDRTLSDRRALLNPDDPLGTKYLDTVSNVMSGYFETTPDMSMTFIEAIVDAGAQGDRSGRRTAKTYEEILASIDPEQIVVVTGEEDNEFHPAAAEPRPAPSGPAVSSPATADAGFERARGASCDVGGGDPQNGICGLFALIGLVVASRRRRVLHRCLDDGASAFCSRGASS
jgi:hypothetical protein